MKTRLRGFTLIELLVVVTVVGFIAAVAIPFLWHPDADEVKARDAAANAASQAVQYSSANTSLSYEQMLVGQVSDVPAVVTGLSSASGGSISTFSFTVDQAACSVQFWSAGVGTAPLAPASCR